MTASAHTIFDDIYTVTWW